MNIDFLKIKNGEMIKIEDIPLIPFDTFCERILFFTSNKGNIVQFFAYENKQKEIQFIIVLRYDDLIVARCDVPQTYVALTCGCEKFHMFEREIAEQFGIKPERHPWMKSVRYHANYSGASDIFGNDYSQDIPGVYNYYTITGDEIHQVGVGPVHAGIIEPGHFRFNCIGEKVLHLEIQLGYQHRGIEQLLQTATWQRLPIIIEGIAGDSAVANSLCFSQACEALLSVDTNKGTKILRTIALELERISNHLGDLGALSGDVAFLPPASYFGRMRGDFLNMLLLIAGSRFGKGLIRPGGMLYQLPSNIRAILIERIKGLKPQVEHVGHLLLNSSSVLARFESTGIVNEETAEKIGLVGVAGRASGINYDVRKSFPTEYYKSLEINIPTETSGDVYARAKVRFNEIIESLRIIELLLESEIEPNSNILNFDIFPKSAFVVTINEGWRGELSHCIMTDEDGHILRYKIKDPSFHNWMGLALSLRGEEISDFPLCNKSFNLSYCGFDL
ncbi:MAG: hydrogenase [Desulfobacterales bacterium]|nr:hydrogenase [Desulfobacterales bacterium]